MLILASGTICVRVRKNNLMTINSEPVLNSISEMRNGGDNLQVNNSAVQHLVICGMCGAVEKQLGPQKTECPNCDDYIY